MNRAVMLSVALCLAVPVAAQQTGNAMRNYSINGQGAGGTSVVGISVLAPGAFNQAYATQDPNVPIVWLSGQVAIGSFVTPNNSVDLNLFQPLVILGNGFDTSSFFNNLFNTNATGSFALNANIGGALTGTSIPLMMAHVTAMVPEGFLVSQVLAPTFLQDGNLQPCTFSPTPGGTPLTLTDDSNVNVGLGFTFNYYGMAFTSCFVISNGSLCFGTADNSFTENVAGFLGGPRRIAEYWDDFNPGTGGTVTAFSDNVSFFEVAFNAVPEFATTNQNSFLIQVDAANGIVTCCYGAMASLDGLVGVSPGGNADPVGTTINLSLANNVITAGSAAFELFTAAGNPSDLPNNSVVWVFDSPATGNPVLQL